MNRTTAIGTQSEFRSHAAEVESQRILSLRLLWSECHFLLRAGVCGFVLSILVAFLLPVSYESETRLMPPENQGGSGLAMLAALATKGGGESTAGSSGDGPASLGRVATGFLGLKTSGALLIDMLSGPSVEDSLIGKFDLRNRYHVKYWQDARKVLEKHTTIKEDRKSGVISIRVSDRDPYRAQEMAKTYVEAVNGLLAQVSTSSARLERMFLEQRLKSVKETLDAASQEYSVYASKTGTLDVPSQAKAMVESEGTLQGQLVAAESELKGLEQTYTDKNIRVRTLKARTASLRQQIEQFSGNTDDPKSSRSQIAGDLPSLRGLPLVGVRWANLHRDLKLQEATYELLTQEYEYAKIQEAKETPTINVLDAALLPERTSFPPRIVITIVGSFLSLLFAAGFILTAARWKRSESPETELAAEIWGQITAENARWRSTPRQLWRKFVGYNGQDNRRC